MTASQKLIDECRELETKLYGKRMELAMLLGDRDAACFWQREMYAVIEAREATKEVGALQGA